MWQAWLLLSLLLAVPGVARLQAEETEQDEAELERRWPSARAQLRS